MTNINNPRIFNFGRWTESKRNKGITALEEAEARVVSGDPQEQLEIISNWR